jgi:hypothetical protein
MLVNAYLYCCCVHELPETDHRSDNHNLSSFLGSVASRPTAYHKHTDNANKSYPFYLSLHSFQQLRVRMSVPLH